jgi:hypothetical protein
MSEWYEIGDDTGGDPLFIEFQKANVRIAKLENALKDVLDTVDEFAIDGTDMRRVLDAAQCTLNESVPLYEDTVHIHAEVYDGIIEDVDAVRYNVDAALRLVRERTRHLTAASVGLKLLLEQLESYINVSETDDADEEAHMGLLPI